MRSDTISRFLFILILAAFSIGLVRLFTLRFQAGDIYPPYSSLRSDPLGCRGLHDALAETGQYTVKRNHTPIDRIKSGSGETWILAGTCSCDTVNVPEPAYNALNRFVTSGGNLVIGFYPQARKVEKKPETPPPGKPDDKKPQYTVKKDKRPSKKAETPDKDKPDDTTEKEKTDGETFGMKTVNLTDLWGFHDDRKPLEKEPAVASPLARYARSFGLGNQSWHSAMFFKDLSPEWKPVYTLEGEPVLIERPVGKGRIILCSDSYFMSNEALKKEANPALLAFLLRDGKTVVFDESHLGIASQEGISGLILKYRLAYFAGALALFALLFAWKNAAVFIPASDMPEPGNVSSRDQASGLASLYKRHIPPSRLLTLCVDEWEKTLITGHNAPDIHRETLETLRSTAKQFESGEHPDPAAGYREIHRLLSEGKET